MEETETPGGKGAPPRHRALRRLALALGIIVIAFLTATAVLFVFPATDQPRHVGAILSLNGTDEAARASKAIALAEEGYSSVLLFSQGNSPTPCPTVPRVRPAVPRVRPAVPRVRPTVPRVRVVCFIAVPGRTVGEVRFATDYARSHGLHSIMVVPSRAQATRAHLLLERCFSGQILVVPASFQLLHFPFEVIYEWGALAKALLVDRHC